MASGQRKKESCIQTTPVLVTKFFSALLNLLFLVTLAPRFRAFEVILKEKRIKGKVSVSVSCENGQDSREPPSNSEQIAWLSPALKLSWEWMKLDTALFKTHRSPPLCDSDVACWKSDHWVYKNSYFPSHPTLLIPVLEPVQLHASACRLKDEREKRRQPCHCWLVSYVDKLSSYQVSLHFVTTQRQESSLRMHRECIRILPDIFF